MSSGIPPWPRSSAGLASAAPRRWWPWGSGTPAPAVLCALLAVGGCATKGNDAGGMDDLGAGAPANAMVGGADMAAGDGGASKAMCTADGWCLEDRLLPGNTSNTLNGIWGTSHDDVWFVGDQGTILHWNGAVRSPSSNDTTQRLQGIWGSAANALWAVGDQGILRWDGTGANDIWAAGYGPRHWDGTSWSDPNYDLNGVWGRAANDVWAVGPGIIRHWNGAA